MGVLKAVGGVERNVQARDRVLRIEAGEMEAHGHYVSEAVMALKPLQLQLALFAKESRDWVHSPSSSARAEQLESGLETLLGTLSQVGASMHKLPRHQEPGNCSSL